MSIRLKFSSLALAAALLAFGFHTSLAGQKLFSGSLVED